MAGIFLAGIELMMAIPALAFFIKMRRIAADIASKQIAWHDGPLRVERVELTNDDNNRFAGYRYEALAGKIKLTVEPAALGEQLLPLAGTSGRLHYAPRSRHVLSFDPR
jgi:hypothetical protein